MGSAEKIETMRVLAIVLMWLSLACAVVAGASVFQLKKWRKLLPIAAALLSLAIAIFANLAYSFSYYKM